MKLIINSQSLSSSAIRFGLTPLLNSKFIKLESGASIGQQRLRQHENHNTHSTKIATFTTSTCFSSTISTPTPAPATVNVINHSKGRPLSRGISRLFSFGSANRKKQQFGDYELVAPQKVSFDNIKSIVPERIMKPSYFEKGLVLDEPTRVELKTKQDIEKMRIAGKLAAQTLEFAGSLVKPGITTHDIDAQVREFIFAADAYPSPLNYKKYPKSICTSVNNVICHGIPDSRPLADGDIINIDVTVFIGGFHGDTNRSFAVGTLDVNGLKLINVATQALDYAISICGPGRPISSIGDIISQYVKSQNLSVNHAFVGHGIGRNFHEPPIVDHTRSNSKQMMEPGMTFTIEPIVQEGSSTFKILSDGWTAVSKDGGRAAAAEHTILITETGYEILTELNPAIN